MRRVIAVILCALCANAPAYELVMTAEEQGMCDQQGGCAVVTREMMQRMMAKAHRAGMATCEQKI